MLPESKHQRPCHRIVNSLDWLSVSMRNIIVCPQMLKPFRGARNRHRSAHEATWQNKPNISSSRRIPRHQNAQPKLIALGWREKRRGEDIGPASVSDSVHAKISRTRCMHLDLPTWCRSSQRSLSQERNVHVERISVSF